MADAETRLRNQRATLSSLVDELHAMEQELNDADARLRAEVARVRAEIARAIEAAADDRNERLAVAAGVPKPSHDGMVAHGLRLAAWIVREHVIEVGG